MKKRIYILDDISSSLKNGVGTYVKELFGCISLSDMDICLVGFNSDIEELNIEYSMDGTLKKISFPPFPTSQYTEYANVFIKIFQIYIPDIVENTFIIKY